MWGRWVGGYSYPPTCVPFAQGGDGCWIAASSVENIMCSAMHVSMYLATWQWQWRLGLDRLRWASCGATLGEICNLPSALRTTVRAWNVAMSVPCLLRRVYVAVVCLKMSYINYRSPCCLRARLPLILSLDFVFSTRLQLRTSPEDAVQKINSLQWLLCAEPLW